jgi:hypothetical protein
MDKEKKSLTITISDLNDFESVAKAISHIFQTILMHYLNENKEKEFIDFVEACGTYFGMILTELGYDDEDNEDELN